MLVENTSFSEICVLSRTPHSFFLCFVYSLCLLLCILFDYRLHFFCFAFYFSEKLRFSELWLSVFSKLLLLFLFLFLSIHISNVSVFICQCMWLPERFKCVYIFHINLCNRFTSYFFLFFWILRNILYDSVWFYVNCIWPRIM